VLLFVLLLLFLLLLVLLLLLRNIWNLFPMLMFCRQTYLHLPTPTYTYFLL
jgi:hypothetical protein